MRDNFRVWIFTWKFSIIKILKVLYPIKLNILLKYENLTSFKSKILN